MATISLDIEDDLLERARARAMELDTTVESLIREYLARLADEASAPRTSGADGEKWQ